MERVQSLMCIIRVLLRTKGCYGGVRDFNAARKVEERKKFSNTNGGGRDIREFNGFIFYMELEDIPIVQRMYTWFKPNSHVKSKLGRVFVSKEWVTHLARELSSCLE